MNNYEHIVQGGVNVLVDELSKASGCHCEWCTYANHREMCYSGSNCRPGIHSWLTAEYKKPDSFEQLIDELEATKLSTYVDIARRIRELLEVKK